MSIQRLMKWLGYALLTVGLVCGWRTWERAFNPAPESDAPAADLSEGPPESVVLSDTKLSAAGIQIAPATERPLANTITVPGRIQYDDTRHIGIRAATAGVLAKVLAQTGDAVEAGQVLAVLSSPEVGVARADVLQRIGELSVLEEQLNWHRKTLSGLQRLTETVGQRKPIAALEQSFADVPLGKNGELIFQAYSRLLLAEALLQAVGGLSDSGVIAQKTVRERQSEQQSAAAALKGVVEEAQFESRQAERQSQVSVDAARRRVEIARQQLNMLLGYVEEVEGLGLKVEGPSQPAPPSPTLNPQLSTLNALSHVEVRAPFAGTIEKKLFSAAERVQLGETLFVLADTRRMWVAADLRERDWAAITLHPGSPMTVTSHALGDRRLDATVLFVGREVAAETHAAPLVGTLDNTDGMLRPGMFVWVTIPISAPRTVLTTPEGAVVQHDGRQFVFVPEGDHRFRPVYVQTGASGNGSVEITSGLTPGEQVVVAGAFFLKSEWLLEREE